MTAVRSVDTGTGEVVDAEIVDEHDVPPAGEQPHPPSAAATPAPPESAGGTFGYDPTGETDE